MSYTRPIPMNRHHHVQHDEVGGFYECVDCLDVWFDWSDPDLHYTECPGVATPAKQAIRDATTGLPDSVKNRIALSLGWVDPEPNNPFHRSVLSEDTDE